MIGANTFDMTPLQMGNCVDDCDAFLPEPAVVLWSYISGRRDVRVPEVVHRRHTMKERTIRTYSTHKLMQYSSKEPLVSVAAPEVTANNGAARFPHQIILNLNFLRTGENAFDCRTVKHQTHFSVN